MAKSELTQWLSNKKCLVQSGAEHGLIKTQETGHKTQLLNILLKFLFMSVKKPIHIRELVFLKVDLYKLNLFLLFPDKISYFGATFGTFFGNFGKFLGTVFFSNNFSFTQLLDNYHFKFGIGKFIWTKKLIMRSGL